MTVPELCRAAATAMRNDWGDAWANDSGEALFHLALADLLDSAANDIEHVNSPVYNLTSTTVARTIAVARAYLGKNN